MAVANEFIEAIRKDTDFERAVPISKMRVKYRDQPDGYARFRNDKRVEKMHKKFDPMALGAIYLSLQDDGTYNVIDGSHRIELALRNGIEALDAYVFIDLTIEEEARLYRTLNDYLKQTALDRYTAAQTEGTPETQVIDRLLAEVGIHVTRSGGPEPGGLQAVSAVENVARDFGPQVLRDSLHILHDAFALNMRGFSSITISGTAQFVIRYLKDPLFQRDKLIREMREQGVSGMLRKRNEIMAAEGSSLGNPWGKAMLFYHNEGLKTRKLPPWVKAVVSEEGKAVLRENIKYAKTASDTARRREVAARAKARVACSGCRAEPGADCLKPDRQSMNADVHAERLFALRKLEAAERAKRKNGKA